MATNTTVSRLLRLPPELRNRVYRAALVDHPPHKGCNTSILLTCYQVHDESSAILASETEVHITIVQKAEEKDWDNVGHVETGTETDVRVHTKQWTAATHVEAPVPGGIPMLNIPDGIYAWPEYLHKIERLRLRISLGGHWQVFGADWAFGDVGTLLFSLASFLEGNHSLKDLEIAVDLGDSELDLAESPDDLTELGLTYIQCMFYPLRRFGDVAKTTLSGLPEKDCKVLMQWMKENPFAGLSLDDEATRVLAQRSCFLRPNLMLRYSRIKHEYEAHERLRSFLGLPQLNNQIPDSLAYHYDMLDRWTGFGLFDERHERPITTFLQHVALGLDEFYQQMSREGAMTASKRAEGSWRDFETARAVSYTHLTLPTKRIV